MRRIAPHISIWDRAAAAKKHIHEIIVAMEHGDRARAESHASIIRDHLHNIQESCDDLMTKAMRELGSSR